MKTVLLLGAGASVAEAIAQGVNQKMLPPTDKSFFDYLERHYKNWYSQLETHSFRKLNLSLKDPSLGMESLFNMIHYVSTDSDQNPYHIAIYKLLLISLQRSIAKSTNAINPRGKSIPQSRSDISKLLNYIRDTSKLSDITIISFNYDLLVERALDFLKLKCNYTREFSNHLDPFKGDKILESVTLNPSKDSIPVLKLHGSLNWLRRSYPNYTLKSKSTNSKANPTLYLGRKSVPYSTNRIPIIVPPIYEKYSEHREIFTPIWEQATNAMHGMERLIVFGYSLPDSDIKAQILLSSGIKAFVNRRSKQVLVDIINIDASVCERFVKKLRLDSLRYYKYVDEFMVKN